MAEEDNSDEEMQINVACVAVMSANMTVIGVFELYMKMHKEPNINRDLARNAYIDSLINGRDSVCESQLRMSKLTFHNLCATLTTLTEKGLLKSTLVVPVEHQVAMFLHTIAHNVKNSTISSRFFRSGETVSRYFNQVLSAILTLRNDYLVQPKDDSPTPEKIADNNRYWPWFKDCIVAIDGTHIRASVPVSIQGRFRSRKPYPTQNVLAVVSYDLRFTYVLAGWEGLAHDSLILDDALRRRNGLIIPNGKYYLGDAGYGIRKGIIPPYRGVRYHLKEFSDHEPQNYKELFNLRHSSLRTTIERGFGVLKKRFPLLDEKKYWSYERQIDIVIACCVIHNYIMSVDPDDEIINGPLGDTDADDTLGIDIEQIGMTQREQQDNSLEWTQKRDDIAHAMYDDYVRS